MQDERRKKTNNQEHHRSPEDQEHHVYTLYAAHQSKQTVTCSTAGPLARCGCLACKQLLEVSQVVVCVGLRDGLDKQSDVTTHSEGGGEWGGIRDTVRKWTDWTPPAYTA